VTETGNFVLDGLDGEAEALEKSTHSRNIDLDTKSEILLGSVHERGNVGRGTHSEG
jgi:hypothetical protein